jgi:hypothetical protein
MTDKTETVIEIDGITVVSNDNAVVTRLATRIRLMIDAMRGVHLIDGAETVSVLLGLAAYYMSRAPEELQPKLISDAQRVIPLIIDLYRSQRAKAEGKLNG